MHGIRRTEPPRRKTAKGLPPFSVQQPPWNLCQRRFLRRFIPSAPPTEPDTSKAASLMNA